MNIGIIGWFTEADFRAAAEKGLSALEFDINDNDMVPRFLEAAPRINRWIAQTGVSVSAVGQWGSTRINQDGSLNHAQLAIEKMLIDGADEVGCHCYITGCNYVDAFSFEENCAFAVAYLGELIEYARPHNIRVCVYNCGWNTFLNCDPGWDAVLGALPELGIKYDPSHAITNGRDYLAEMRKWGRRIYHFHVKGTLALGDGRFDFPPAGLDETDWRTVMGLLYAAGYDGTLSLEPHSDIWKGELGEKGVELSVRYIKSLMA